MKVYVALFIIGIMLFAWLIFHLWFTKHINSPKNQENNSQITSSQPAQIINTSLPKKSEKLDLPLPETGLPVVPLRKLTEKEKRLFKEYE